MGTSQHTNLVLFDGVCNLCNGFVRFLLRHDRRGRLTFGSLQSESARRLLSRQAEAVAGRCAVYRAGQLEEAVKLAAGNARSGQVVLLSPGCASWDQFDNYEARGRMFAEYALRFNTEASTMLQ